MPCGQPIGWLTRTCDIRVSGGGSLGNGTTRSPLPAPDVENAGGFGQAAPDIVKPAVSQIANNRPLKIADISAAFAHKIGRASCRESGCHYVWISVVAVTLKKKQ